MTGVQSCLSRRWCKHHKVSVSVSITGSATCTGLCSECGATWMKISTSKSKSMDLDWEKVACPLQESGESLPQVREGWSVRLTGRSVHESMPGDMIHLCHGQGHLPISKDR